MKRLQLKNVAPVTEPKKTEADVIFDGAKEALKRVICKGHKPDYSKDETDTIEVRDLCEDIFVERRLTDGTTEMAIEVRRITCLLDGSVFVEDMDGNEWDTMSIYDLCAIADTAERSYELRKKGLL